MLVCHCKNVSDRAVRSCVREGARTRADIARKCGAGTGARCGGCRPLIDELVEEERARHEGASLVQLNVA